MNEGSTQEGAPGEYAVVRKVALELLCETEAGSRFVDEVLSEHIGRFERRDRHLLQEISYGALRHQNTLDRLLKFYVKLSMDRQRAPVRWALRLGAYQLVYLSRVPAHAAVNQTLEGMKSFQGIGRKDVGFVNAILHRLIGDVTRKTGDEPAEPDDPSILPVRAGSCHFSRPVLPSSVKLDSVELRRLRAVDGAGVERVRPVSVRVLSSPPPIDSFPGSTKTTRWVSWSGRSRNPRTTSA